MPRSPGSTRRSEGVEAQIARSRPSRSLHRARPSTREPEAAAARAQLDEAKRRAPQRPPPMYRSETGVDVYADMLDVDDVNQVAFSGTKYLRHLSELRQRRGRGAGGPQVADRDAPAASGGATRAGPKAKQAQADRRAGRARRSCAPSSSSSATRPRRKRPTSSRSSRRSSREGPVHRRAVASLQATSTVVSAVPRRAATRPEASDVVPRACVRCRARSPTGSVRVSTRSSGRCAIHTGVDMHAAQGEADPGGARRASSRSRACRAATATR